MKIGKRLCVILEFGIPNYRRFIFEFLNDKFFDLIVIHNGEKFAREEYPFRSVKCLVIRFYRIKFYLGINKYVRQSDYVISSFNLWRPSCLLPLFFYRKKKVLLWGHIRGKHDNFVVKFIKRQCVKRAYKVLSYTNAGMEYAVASLGVPKSKVVVLRNTVDVTNSRFSSFDKRYFIFVGRVQKRKKLEEFICSLSKFSFKEEKLRVIGDGDHKNELIKLVDRLGLNNVVTFHGGTFDDNVLFNHFKGAMAYVSPSHLGLGVVHSFAYGVPVIINKDEHHGPEVEYCNEDNSFFYRTEKQLFNIIRQLNTDATIYLNKGQKGYDFYQSYLHPKNMKAAFISALID